MARIVPCTTLPKEHAMKGIWLSEGLSEIPDYDSNFTNWIDCICYKGQIKLEISKGNENKLVMEINVPVLYYGAVEGYVRLNKFFIDQSDMTIRGITTGYEISKLMVTDENILIIRKLFNEQREFRKVR